MASRAFWRVQAIATEGGREINKNCCLLSVCKDEFALEKKSGAELEGFHYFSAPGWKEKIRERGVSLIYFNAPDVSTLCSKKVVSF